MNVAWLEKASSAVVCLAVALSGALIAWLWLTHHPWLAVVPFAALVILGYFGDRAARTRLLPTKPVASVWWMECWIFVPSVAAAFTSGVLIFLGVWLEPSQTATVEQKKLLAAISGALGAFAATLIINAAQDVDVNFMSGHVRKAFQARYKRRVSGASPEPRVCYLRPDSECERWVFSEDYRDVHGWGWSARHERARKIAERLKHDSVS